MFLWSGMYAFIARKNLVWKGMRKENWCMLVIGSDILSMPTFCPSLVPKYCFILYMWNWEFGLSLPYGSGKGKYYNSGFGA